MDNLHKPIEVPISSHVKKQAFRVSVSAARRSRLTTSPPLALSAPCWRGQKVGSEVCRDRAPVPDPEWMPRPSECFGARLPERPTRSIANHLIDPSTPLAREAG